MVGPVTYTTVPTFGNSSDRVEPGAPLYSDGFLPEDMLPAQYLNWFLNGLTGNNNLDQTALAHVILELDQVVTDSGASLAPADDTQVSTAISKRIRQHLTYTGSHTGGTAPGAFVGDVFVTINSAGATSQDFSAGGATTGVTLVVRNIGSGIATITVAGATSFDLYQYSQVQMVWDGTAWQTFAPGTLQYTYTTGQTPSAFRADAFITVNAAGNTTQDLRAGAVNAGCQVVVYNFGAGTVSLTLATNNSISMGQYKVTILRWNGTKWIQVRNNYSAMTLTVASSAATVYPDDGVENVNVTTGAGNQVITLPALGNRGRDILITKVDSGAGQAQVTAAGSDKIGIEGNATTFALYALGDYVRLRDQITYWQVIGTNGPEIVTAITTLSQGTPTQNTWYSAANFTLPAGVWDLQWECEVGAAKANALGDVHGTISTANNSETDAEISADFYQYLTSGQANMCTLSRQKRVVQTASASRYFNIRTTTAGMANIYAANYTNGKITARRVG